MLIRMCLYPMDGIVESSPEDPTQKSGFDSIKEGGVTPSSSTTGVGLVAELFGLVQ